MFTRLIIKFVGRYFLTFAVLAISAFAIVYLAERALLAMGIRFYIPGIVNVGLMILLYFFGKRIVSKIAPYMIAGALGLVAAFCVYLGVEYLHHGLFKSHNVQAGLAIAGVISGILVAARRGFKQHFTAKSLEEIDNLGNGDSRAGGFLFEDYIASLYNELGYEAHTIAELKRKGIVKTKGFDQGGDVILKFINNGRLVVAVVQCKLYSKPVSNKAVQEAHTAIGIYKPLVGAEMAIVLTNNYYTDAAIELAQANNVALVNRDQLAALIERAKNPKLAQMLDRSHAA
jgi:restriction system protein